MSACDNKESDFKATNKHFSKSFPKIFPVSRCARPVDTHTQITPIRTDTHAGPREPHSSALGGSRKRFAETKQAARGAAAFPIPVRRRRKESREVEKCPGKLPAVPPTTTQLPHALDAKRGGEPGSRTYSGDPHGASAAPAAPRRLRPAPRPPSSPYSDRSLAASPGPASRPPAPL